MILFFTRGICDSDAFIKHCYAHFASIMKPGGGGDYPPDAEVVREKGKKPRLSAGDARFSLAHSHGVMVAAFSHTEIGADIEKIRPIDRSKFPFIDAADDKEFFVQWTQRESYCKFTGEGIRAVRAPIPADAHFEHFDVFDGYHVCVCAEEQCVLAYEIDPAAVGEK